MLYISDIPLDFLGWKENIGTEPLPYKTWSALRQVPFIFSGVGLGMFGLFWIIERRQRLAKEQKGKGEHIGES